MNNWTISKRIIFGFAAITLIAVSLGVFAEFKLRAIRGNTSRITGDCLPGLHRSAYLAENIQLLANQNSTLVLKHIMALDDDLKLDFENQVQTNLLAMTRMVGDYEKSCRDSDERKLTATVVEVCQTYQEMLTRILHLSKTGNVQEAMELKQQKLEPAHELVQVGVHQLVEFNNAKGEAAGKQIQHAVAWSETGIWIGLATNILAASVISFVISYGTTKTLKQLGFSLSEASAEVSATAIQVNQTSLSLAEGATQQSVALVQTGAVLEQIADMARRNSESARAAQQLASHTRKSADAGFHSMQELSRAVEDIRNCNRDIINIVKSIDEIAFQTNILALNAAVEAARAGEAGLGFAVVAEEVRNLALRSAEAASETARKIGASLEKSEHGVAINAKVARGLSEIVDQVRKADAFATEIANASQEQATDIIQVKESVAGMDRITKKNSTNAKEAAAAAGALSSESENLEAVVQNISQLVGGRSAENLSSALFSSRLPALADPAGNPSLTRRVPLSSV